MNIETLKDRLKILNTQLQDANDRINQAIADLNIINGAILETNYWINFINSDIKQN